MRRGSMPCPAGCGTQDAAAEETASGTLNVKCHRCGFSGYGKNGTRAKRLLEARIVPDPEDEAGAPPPAPAASAAPPAPSPAPAAPAPSRTLLG